MQQRDDQVGVGYFGGLEQQTPPIVYAASVTLALNNDVHNMLVQQRLVALEPQQHFGAVAFFVRPRVSAVAFVRPRVSVRRGRIEEEEVRSIDFLKSQY